MDNAILYSFSVISIVSVRPATLALPTKNSKAEKKYDIRQIVISLLNYSFV